MTLFAIVKEPTTDERIDRYEQFPWWAQKLIDNPAIWQLWLPGLVFFLAVWFFTLSMVFDSIGLSTLSIFGLIFFMAYLYYAFETIEENENGKPQFGLLEVLGMRLPIVFDEGLAMKIPFFSRIVRRSKEQFNDDIEIPQIKCRLNPLIEEEEGATFYEEVAHALNTPSPSKIKSGGSVKIGLGLTFERDWTNGWAVLEYDNIGETEGFRDISKDAIEADLREVGRRLTWLQAAFATDLISAYLVMKLTGETTFKRRKILKEPTPERIAAFLDDVRINGRAYIRGLGVNIRRIEIKSVDPIGELAQASEKAAVEEMKRRGLVENVNALAEAVEVLKDKFNDGSLKHKDLVNIIQVDEDGSRVEKKILEINAENVDKFANAFKSWVAKK